MTRTTIADPKAEDATAILLATLTDVDGVTPLALASTVLMTLLATLYVERTGEVINLRSAQSVKNTNGGAVYDALQTAVDGVTTYNFMFRLDPADMPCLIGTVSEAHVLLLSWTWGSPLKTGHHEIAFTVTNLLKVT